MWVGVMTFQYSQRLLRPQPWRPPMPDVSTSGERAKPTAAGLSRPFGRVSETGAVSSRSGVTAGAGNGSGAVIGILADGSVRVIRV